MSTKKLLIQTECHKKKKKQRVNNTPFYQRRFENVNQFDFSEQQNQNQ